MCVCVCVNQKRFREREFMRRRKTDHSVATYTTLNPHPIFSLITPHRCTRVPQQPNSLPHPRLRHPFSKQAQSPDAERCTAFPPHLVAPRRRPCLGLRTLPESPKVVCPSDTWITPLTSSYYYDDSNSGALLKKHQTVPKCVRRRAPSHPDRSSSFKKSIGNKAVHWSASSKSCLPRTGFFGVCKRIFRILRHNFGIWAQNITKEPH